MNSIKCEFCETEFSHKNPKRRFCSIKCVNNWQRSVSWEERIGTKRANEIRDERKKQLLENNPNDKLEVRKKKSASLTEYYAIDENKRVRR